MKVTFNIDDPPKTIDPATGKPFEWGLHVELVTVPAGQPAVTVGTSLGPDAPAKPPTPAKP